MNGWGTALRAGALALAASLWTSSALAGALQLPELMRVLAQVHSKHAHFEQERHLAALDVPLRSQGELVYEAPGRLEKHTLSPHDEALCLDGNRLTIDRPGKPAVTLDIRNYPQAAAIIASVRETLAGDAAGLERWYQVGVSGTLDHWQLHLVPKLASVRDLFRSIEIAGAGNAVCSVRYLAPDGDSTVLRIREVSGT